MLVGVAGGAAAQNEHGPVNLAGQQWRVGQGVGAVGAEAVQEEAEVPLPGVGGAGGADGLEDAGVAPGHRGEVFEGEVGAELAAPLGAVEDLGDHLEQAGLGGLHGGGAGEPHAHDVVEAAVGGLQPAGLLQVVSDGS
jgi:hypothetical protein